MPNKTIDMITIRQILRLHALGKGSKYISQATGVARNTVKKYLQRFSAMQTTMDELDRMGDAELSRVFFASGKTVPPTKRASDLAPLLPAFAAMPKKRGVTKGMAYRAYALQCPGGYRISAFIEKLNLYMSIGRPSMEMEHLAGDKMSVDFTGKKLQLVDRHTGEVGDVEVFVAILGCSQLTFVMAVATQQKDDFIMACEKALHFYGGVPRAIVPDNLRSAVTRANRYEAELNGHFAAFAEHYRTFGFPARAYKPKDKALVEGAVKIIYTTIFSKVDEKVYHQLDDLNTAVLQHLRAHNTRPLTGLDQSRQQQFDTLEKHALQPLNPYPFELMSSQLSTVNKYGHVLLSVDKRYYSVPYTLIGKRLKLRYDARKLEVCDDGAVPVAVHDRYSGMGNKYVTQQDHLASHHRFLSDWNPQKFMATATGIGPAVASFIARILAREQYPEQSYKSCSGVPDLAKRVGNQRLSNACKRADGYGLYNYGIIDQILRSGADHIPPDDGPVAASVPPHENIRGQGYYE